MRQINLISSLPSKLYVLRGKKACIIAHNASLFRLDHDDSSCISGGVKVLSYGGFILVKDKFF